MKNPLPFGTHLPEDTQQMGNFPLLFPDLFTQCHLDRKQLLLQQCRIDGLVCRANAGPIIIGIIASGIGIFLHFAIILASSLPLLFLLLLIQKCPMASFQHGYARLNGPHLILFGFGVLSAMEADLLDLKKQHFCNIFFFIFTRS
jgi:hypothetical protein